MNAIDAGATSVHVTCSDDGRRVVVSDDGSGFADLSAIVNFFETFGTPHIDDTPQFGRFRIGRGQIMCFGATTWRSGHHEMHVDLQNAVGDFGYELRRVDVPTPGCTVVIELYQRHGWFLNAIAPLVRHVRVPVLLNDQQVSQSPESERWHFEDAFAWYRFDREAELLDVYNMGVLVGGLNATTLGTGGTVVSKQALRVNTSRNSILESDNWTAIQAHIRNHFLAAFAKPRKLTWYERVAMCDQLIFSAEPPQLSGLHKALLFKDVFGVAKDSRWLFENDVATIYDGVNRGIAERVNRLGRATVIDSTQFHSALKKRNAASSRNNTSAETIRETRNIFNHLRRLFMESSGAPNHTEVTWLDFDELVREYSDTHTQLADETLNKAEKAALAALRHINDDVAALYGVDPRMLRAGVADRMLAWTDGTSYITIHRAQLLHCGRSRQHRLNDLITILFHEYAHNDASAGEHHHDPAFYERYHNASLTQGSRGRSLCGRPRSRGGFGHICEEAERAHLKALESENAVMPADVGIHVRWMGAMAPRLGRHLKERPHNRKAKACRVHDAHGN